MSNKGNIIFFLFGTTNPDKNMHKVIQVSALQKIAQFANNRAVLLIKSCMIYVPHSHKCVTDFTLTKNK